MSVLSCAHIFPNTPFTTASTSELRWHLFCKNHYEGENLSPTLNALKFKIWRSHLVTTGFKWSAESHPNVLSLLAFGCKEPNYKYNPAMTNQLSVPEVTTEMSTLCLPAKRSFLQESVWLYWLQKSTERVYNLLN